MRREQKLAVVVAMFIGASRLEALRTGARGSVGVSMLAFASVNPLAVLSAPRVLDEHPMQRT